MGGIVDEAGNDGCWAFFGDGLNDLAGGEPPLETGPNDLAGAKAPLLSKAVQHTTHPY